METEGQEGKWLTQGRQANVCQGGSRRWGMEGGFVKGLLIFKWSLSRGCSYYLEKWHVNKRYLWANTFEIRIWFIRNLSKEVVKINSKSTYLKIYLLRFSMCQVLDLVIMHFQQTCRMNATQERRNAITHPSWEQLESLPFEFTSVTLSAQGLSHFTKWVFCLGPLPVNSCKVPDWHEAGEWSQLKFSITEICSCGLLGTTQHPRDRVVTYTAAGPRRETFFQGLARAVWFSFSHHLRGWIAWLNSLFRKQQSDQWVDPGRNDRNRRKWEHALYIHFHRILGPSCKEGVLIPFHCVVGDERDLLMLVYLGIFQLSHTKSQTPGIPQSWTKLGHVRWMWGSASTAKSVFLNFALSCFSSMKSSDRPSTL